jgi:uncharacterized membrane protein (GlpM family)
MLGVVKRNCYFSKHSIVIVLYGYLESIYLFLGKIIYPLSLTVGVIVKVIIGAHGAVPP